MGGEGRDGPAKEGEAAVVVFAKLVMFPLAEAGELLFAVVIVVFGVPLVTIATGAGAGAGAPASACCRCLPACKTGSRA